MQKYIFLLFILLFTSAYGAHAQQHAQDFIGVNQGDLYAWSTNNTIPQALTSWGYNGGPVVSPDGQWIAYLSLPEAITSANIDEQFLRETPHNIWIMNTRTRDFARVAGDNNNTSIERGIPVWSPDSTQLMWVEKQRNNLTAQVVIYDRVNQSRRVLIEQFNPSISGGQQFLPALRWSSDGISYMRSTDDGQSILFVYRTLSGAVPPETITLSTQSSTAIIDHIWVNNGSNEQIVVVDLQGNWSVIDPTVMQQSSLNNPPSLVLRNNPGALALTPYVRTGQGGRSFSWRVTVGGTQRDLNYSSDTLSLESLPAIAADGRSVAWTSYPALGETALYHYFLDTSTISNIRSGSNILGAPAPSSVIGAPTQWVTNYSQSSQQPIPTPAHANVCNMPTRLKVGQQITVTQGLPNRVRSTVGLSAPVIASFSPGDVAQLINGPLCVDSLQWWQVSNSNFTGWTAEGQDGIYWLETVATPSQPTGNNNPCRMTPTEDTPIYAVNSGTGNEPVGTIRAGETVIIEVDGLNGSYGFMYAGSYAWIRGVLLGDCSEIITIRELGDRLGNQQEPLAYPVDANPSALGCIVIGTNSVPIYSEPEIGGERLGSLLRNDRYRFAEYGEDWQSGGVSGYWVHIVFNPSYDSQPDILPSNPTFGWVQNTGIVFYGSCPSR